MEYREYIYHICSDTNLDNQEDVIDTMQFLALECIKHESFAIMCDDKLKELMSAKEYEEWAKETAKELFKKDVDMMPEGDFKDFATEHLEEILSEEI